MAVLVMLGKYIVEWSTICDGPLTHGMTRVEFTRYYKQKYGEEGLRGLPERMVRLERTGTSSGLHKSAEDLVSTNRAGPNESCVPFDQLVEWAAASRKKARG